jgi:hypothetical protein
MRILADPDLHLTAGESGKLLLFHIISGFCSRKLIRTERRKTKTLEKRYGTVPTMAVLVDGVWKGGGCNHFQQHEKGLLHLFLFHMTTSFIAD